jgi:hypothetical protein
MSTLKTKNIIILVSLILIVFITSCKKNEFNESENFVAKIQICDSQGNILSGLETRVFLNESTYNSGIADKIFKTKNDYFEINLSNSENFFWIEVFAKDKDNNQIKINLNDKYALPSKSLNQIKYVDYKVTVKDPIIYIYKILFETGNIKDEKYINKVYLPWDEGSSTEQRPDLQLIITDIYTSPIFMNVWTFGTLSINANITIGDLDKEQEFLLIDNDNSSSYDLIFSDKVVFRKIMQKGLVGLPIEGHNQTFSNYYTIYGSLDGANDRPIVIYFNPIWN